ncbi:iron uptake system protein EfeO, partial [Neisseria sp. P0018.S004]
MFGIRDGGGRGLGWEILEGVMVVDERENIAPGLSDKMAVTLLSGEYEVVCGLLMGLRGRLIVVGGGFGGVVGGVGLGGLFWLFVGCGVCVWCGVGELVVGVGVFVGVVGVGGVGGVGFLFVVVCVCCGCVGLVAGFFGGFGFVVGVCGGGFGGGVGGVGFVGFCRVG